MVSDYWAEVDFTIFRCQIEHHSTAFQDDVEELKVCLLLMYEQSHHEFDDICQKLYALVICQLNSLFFKFDKDSGELFAHLLILEQRY